MAAPDLVIVDATVVTVDDADTIAEAVAIADGMIIAVGRRAEIERLADDSTETIDANGATLLPGFIDPHSHVGMGAPFFAYAALQVPPVGDVRTVDDIMAKLRETRERLDVQPGEWLIGWGYFPDDMHDGDELTAERLDREFADYKTVVMHVSMHGGVVNQRVLDELGYGDGTVDPEGGSIVRVAGTRRPDGTLWEAAWMPLMFELPGFDADDLHAMLREYARWGVTTVQDGASATEQVELLQSIAATSPLPIDVVSLVIFSDFEAALANDAITFDAWRNGHKVRGVKLILDGAPQGRTAHVTEEYETGGPSGEQHWHGIAVIDQETTNQVVEAAYRTGIQVYAHCNGDAAIEQLTAAHRTALAAGAPYPGRTVPIHSQVMRHDQLDEYVELGFEPSMFTVHTFFWGDVHITNFGRERADGISPMASAFAKGLKPTNHSDYPVTPINPLLHMWSSISRTTLTGAVLGEGERLTPVQALRAVTINAAYEYGEEHSRGSIEVGKLADLVLLSANPLEVATDDLTSITVERTIKRGTTVYAAD